jgi:voltage-gated potassium channel
MQIVSSILKRKKPELTITFVIIFVLLILSASLMYYVEHDAQPNEFGSIPETLWWSVSTLTTVGYGDVTPITPFGKVCAGFIALLGIGMFALPAGILASGFEQELSSRETLKLRCPHCQKGLYLREEVLLTEAKSEEQAGESHC